MQYQTQRLQSNRSNRRVGIAHHNVPASVRQWWLVSKRGDTPRIAWASASFVAGDAHPTCYPPGRKGSRTLRFPDQLVQFIAGHLSKVPIDEADEIA